MAVIERCRLGQHDELGPDFYVGNVTPRAGGTGAPDAGTGEETRTFVGGDGEEQRRRFPLRSAPR